MVERVLYLQDANTGYTGGGDVVGAAPQTSWYFAEGFTSPATSERYFLFNPSTTTPAVATMTFYRDNGTTAITQMVLAAGQQQIVSANGVLGMNINNGSQIQATSSIIAERFTSLQYSGSVGVNGNATIPGATDVFGTAAPGQTFYFAEGYTGGLFAEWLSVVNPTTSAATVTVTFQPAGGGTPTTNTYTVNATSRFQVYTNSVMSNQSFSMKVTSTVTIVAERVMYFNNGGQTGATDVIGYQG